MKTGARQAFAVHDSARLSAGGGREGRRLPTQLRRFDLNRGIACALCRTAGLRERHSGKRFAANGQLAYLFSQQRRGASEQKVAAKHHKRNSSRAFCEYNLV